LVLAEPTAQMDEHEIRASSATRMLSVQLSV
jgi:hypothetical protein